MLCESFLWPVIYQPKMGIVKTRKLVVWSNIFFPKMEAYYRTRSADICLVMLAVGQEVHSLSKPIL